MINFRKTENLSDGMRVIDAKVGRESKKIKEVYC
jgi:hypothetical protein